GGGGDDAVPIPRAAVASGGDHSGDAVVGAAAGPGDARAGAVVVVDQIVVRQVQRAGKTDGQSIDDQHFRPAGGQARGAVDDQAGQVLGRVKDRGGAAVYGDGHVAQRRREIARDRVRAGQDVERIAAVAVVKGQRRRDRPVDLEIVVAGRPLR